MIRTTLAIVFIGMVWPSLRAETIVTDAASVQTVTDDAAVTVSVGDLTNADLTGADLTGADLTGAELNTSEVIGNAVSHRLWVVSTRSLSSNACAASLDSPAFRVWQLDRCGCTTSSTLDELLESRDASIPLWIQVHGNRMESDDAIERGLFVYHKTIPYFASQSLDYVIFSWPSEKDGLLVNDGREKADRTDAEGLYLAWLVREFSSRGGALNIVGYSFGGRVATGAMHALAGGSLGGRTLPGEHIQGANVRVGLVAPALEDSWLRPGSYHGMASLNIQRMTILYNQRDAVLKRYWLLEQVRGRMALGYTGPHGIGPRVDGSPMPVHSCDCSLSMGIYHDEKKYYTESCQAGRQMARLFQTVE